MLFYTEQGDTWEAHTISLLASSPFPFIWGTILSLSGLCHDFQASLMGSGELFPPLYHDFCHMAQIINFPPSLYLTPFSTCLVSQISFIIWHSRTQWRHSCFIHYHHHHLPFMFTGNNCILRTTQQGQHSCHMVRLQVEEFISLNLCNAVKSAAGFD